MEPAFTSRAEHSKRGPLIPRPGTCPAKPRPLSIHRARLSPPTLTFGGGKSHYRGKTQIYLTKLQVHVYYLTKKLQIIRFARLANFDTVPMG